MKKLKLIYNPHSGGKGFKNELDTYVEALQNGGFDVSVFRAGNVGDIDGYIAETGAESDVILASGGDGTVSLVVNAMIKNDVHSALGIIPSGTANDFARYLGFTDMSAEELCGVFAERNITPCDVGCANGTYFINVCGGGLLTQVGHTVEPGMKDIFGKMSYYIKGIAQIPNFCPIPLRLTTEAGVIEDEVYLYLILNSPGAGSFDNIAQRADISDGLLDFFAVRARPLPEIVRLFIRLLAGEHFDDPAVLHVSGSSFNIDALTDDELCRASSIDGDKGPCLPLDVSVVPGAIKLLTKKESGR